MNKEEILYSKLGDHSRSMLSDTDIYAAMDDYAKRTSIEFYNWATQEGYMSVNDSVFAVYLSGDPERKNVPRTVDGYQELFDAIVDTNGIATQSEMMEIIHIVHKYYPIDKPIKLDQ